MSYNTADKLNRSPSPTNPEFHSAASTWDLHALAAKKGSKKASFKGSFPTAYGTGTFEVLTNRALHIFGYYKPKNPSKQWTRQNKETISYARDNCCNDLIEHPFGFFTSNEALQFLDGKGQFTKVKHHRVFVPHVTQECWREFHTAVPVSFSKVGLDYVLITLLQFAKLNPSFLITSCLFVGVTKGTFNVMATKRVYGQSSLNTLQKIIIECSAETVTCLFMLYYMSFGFGKFNSTFKSTVKGALKQFAMNGLRGRQALSTSHEQRLQFKECLIEGTKCGFKAFIRQCMKWAFIFMTAHYLLGMAISLAIADIIGCVIATGLLSTFVDYPLLPPARRKQYLSIKKTN